jgi:hypothetical protein
MLLLQIDRLDAFATIRPAASVMACRAVGTSSNSLERLRDAARSNASGRRLFRPTLLPDERFQAPFKHR